MEKGAYHTLHSIRRRIRRFLLSYSRVIGMAKIWMLSLAALTLGILFIYPQVMEQKKLFSLSISPDILNEAQTSTMTNLRFTYVDRDKNPLTVTSELAEEVPGTQVVTLTNPKASMSVTQDEDMMMSSETGIMDRKAQTVRLSGNIEIFSSKGYEASAEVLDIDMRERTVTSDREVRGRGDFGNIVASGITITDNGNKIFFKGKSRMVLHEGSLK